MSSKVKEHRNALVLCVLALISGVLFVWFSPHPGLWGDALGYYKAAIRFQEVLFVQNDPNLSVFLIRSPWLVLPLALFAAIFMPLGESVFLHAFYIFQVVFYAINLLLIYAISLELTGQKKYATGAMLAGLLYTPFLFYTDHLLRETLHTTFLLAFAWCFLKGKDRWGCAFLFLALTSNYFAASAQGLGLLLVLGITYGLYCLLFNQKPETTFLKRIGFYAAGFAGGYIVLTLLFGLIKYQALDNVTLAQFADTEGWGVIAPFHGEISMRTAAHTVSLPGVFNVLAPTWQNTIKWLLFDPPQFITTYTTNLYRFFAHPSNVYHRTWILPPSALLLYHQLAVAAFGLSLPLILKVRRLWLLYLFPLVWALSFSIIHIEDRYNVIVMPFVLIAATCGFQHLWEACSKRRIALLALVIAGLILWLQGHLSPLFIGLGVTPRGYFLLGIILGAIGFGVVFVRTLAPLKPKPRLSPAMLGFLGALAIFFPVLTVLAQGPVQLSHPATLLKNQTAAEKTIPLEGGFFSEPGLETYLLIDVTPFSPGCLNININNQPLETAPVSPPVGLGMQQYLTGKGLLPAESFRQYMFIPVSKSLDATLAKSKEAHITITNNCATPVALYGDYPAGGGQYWVPTPHWGEYSIYKAIYDRDGRIPRLLEAAEGSQSLLNGKKQPFRFRIMLFRLVPGEGRQWGYPLAEFRVDDTGRLFKLYRLAY